MTTETAVETAKAAAPAAKKTPAKKPAAKKAAAPAPKPAANGVLTPGEVKVLGVLAKAKGPLTRKELAAKTEINKGWSRILGAATKEVSSDSLEGQGYVKPQVDPEGGRTLLYVITAAGKKALEKHGK